MSILKQTPHNGNCCFLSSSYAPLEDHPNHAPLLTGLADLFARYAMEGRVRFEYKTELFYGKLT
jgi:hypothetical protein